MKSTGIVRKIDELGRVVLPIELRRTLDIANKDALEIFVDEDMIILRKYRRATLAERIQDLIETADQAEVEVVLPLLQVALTALGCDAEADQADAEEEVVYVAECPTCGYSFQPTDEEIAAGGVICPRCYEKLEFTLEGAEEIKSTDTDTTEGDD